MCAVCDVRSDSCGRALTSASKHVVVAEVLNPRRIFIAQCERGVLRPRPTVARLCHYYYRKVELVIVKTKKRWSGGRRWLESAAMEIFDCVDCFHGRPRLRVREPRTPSESPPPPYRRFSSRDLLRPEDAAPSEDSQCLVESQETGGTHDYGSYSTHGPGSVIWCRVAYWEGRERVGRLYPVRSSSLNIMGNIPHGEGLSLASLAASSHTSPSEQVRRTREKIGLGLVLYQDGDGVWLYNRAEIPLFVNSPTLDGGIHCRADFIVHKLPPGHILNIFDYEKAREYQKLPVHPALLHVGPIDQNSVHVSFAKGWGPNYRRQAITECPCWLEILLVPAR